MIKTKKHEKLTESNISHVIELLRSGSLYTNKYQLDGVVSCEPFFDRFESEVAGWVATMDILIDNDINIC